MLIVLGLTRRYLVISCLVLAMGTLSLEPVHAGDPPADTGRKVAKSDFVPARPPGGGPVRREIRRRPNDHLVAVLLRQYDTLQETIHSQMELPPEQARKVDAVIDNYRQQARENTHLIGLFHVSTAARFHGGRVGPQSEPPQHDLSKLASTPHDPQSETSSEGRIMDGDFYEYHDMIIEEVFFAVEGREQRSRLWPILMRWLTLQRPPAYRDGPMGRILRAARDPDLDLTDEKRSELLALISGRMREHMRDRFNEEKLTPVAEELRREVVEKLDPRHREHFLATLRLLDEEAEVVKRLIEEVEAKKVASAEKSQDVEQK